MNSSPGSTDSAPRPGSRGFLGRPIERDVHAKHPRDHPRAAPQPQRLRRRAIIPPPLPPAPGPNTSHSSDSAASYSVNRYYDPATGQFLTVDPLVDQTGQPYAYTAEDPINNSDLNGDFSCAEGCSSGGNLISEPIIVNDPWRESLTLPDRNPFTGATDGCGGGLNSCVIEQPGSNATDTCTLGGALAMCVTDDLSGSGNTGTGCSGVSGMVSSCAIGGETPTTLNSQPHSPGINEHGGVGTEPYGPALPGHTPGASSGDSGDELGTGNLGRNRGNDYSKYLARKYDLDSKQQRTFHDEISGQNYDRKTLKEIAEDIAGG